MTFSDEVLIKLFGSSRDLLVQGQTTEWYYQSCVTPIVKHPEAIHFWCCFSSGESGSLTTLLKKAWPWTRNGIETFSRSNFCQHPGAVWRWMLSLHDGAPCHTAKYVTKKWREHLYFGLLLRKCSRSHSYWELMVSHVEEGREMKTEVIWPTQNTHEARIGCHQQGPGTKGTIQHARMNCQGCEWACTVNIEWLHTAYSPTNKSCQKFKKYRNFPSIYIIARINT